MSTLKVIVDGIAEVPAHNTIKVILDDEDGVERHYAITHEGVILDIVCDGEIVSSRCYQHGDLDGQPSISPTDSE